MARFLPSQSFSAPLQIPANPIRNATWTLNSNQFRLKRLNRLQHISNSQPSRFKRARNRATTDSSCATSGSLSSPNSPSHSILKSPGINKRCLSGRTIANCFSAYKKPSAITFKASRNRTTPKANWTISKAQGTSSDLWIRPEVERYDGNGSTGSQYASSILIKGKGSSSSEDPY